MATRQAPAHRRTTPAPAEPTPKRARRAATPTKAATRRQRFRRRYAVVYDIEGPRVRLGVLWFVIAFVALVLGLLPAAVVYGSAAAVGAAQTARVWRRHTPPPHRIVAAATGGGLALAASFGPGVAGAAVLVATGAAVFVAATDAKSRAPVVSAAGWTIQCGLPVGVAAMSMVLLARLDQGSAIALLLLVSAYETGDYLIGSGARNPYEGPVAGIAAVIVVTFIVSSVSISAFDVGQAWIFGAAVAVLAPLGQLLASAVLPTAGAPASGLRRLDSLLLAAPVWWLAVNALT